MIARTLQRSRRIFFAATRFHVSLPRNPRRTQESDQDHCGTTQYEKEVEEEKEEAAYCRDVTDQSESPRHDSRRSLARSRVRLSSKRSLQRRDIGLDSNGSEIVVSAFVPPGRPLLTQLRERTLFFGLLLSSFLQIAPSSLVSLGHAFVFAPVSLRRERARASACPCTSDPTTGPGTPCHLL